MGETLGGRIRGGRTHARKLQLLLVLLVLAGAATFAAPGVALGGTGETSSGVTTYVVNTAKNEIDVTTTFTLKNTKKSKVSTSACYTYYTCTDTTNYYFYGFTMIADEAGGAVNVTSNAGKVSQGAYKGSSTIPPSMRAIDMTYPATWYGQTRVVTAKYAIPGGLTAATYRALKGYVSVCAMDNVWTNVDNATINIVLPAGFKVLESAGMSPTTAADGTLTLSAKNMGRWLQYCVEAVNPSALESTPASGGSATFAVNSWPEDAAWKTKVAGFVAVDGPKIEAFTGLPMAKGPFTIAEAAAPEVGVTYDTDAGPIVRLATNATEAQVMAAMAEQGYASAFADHWMAAGLAGYAAQGSGDGSAVCPPSSGQQLVNWGTVEIDSADRDRVVHDQQEAGACFIFSSWAKAMGHDRFVAALAAAARGENPYAEGVTTAATAATPITARLLLDMVDERGMIPAGVTDLDKAQSLLTNAGVFDASDLGARSTARTQYHALAADAGGWKLPPVIRDAMTGWDFSTATTAMDSATEILKYRDQAQKDFTGLKLDGTKLQEGFESAKTQADLDATVALARLESQAATKVADAARLQSADRSLFQSIGLIGSDVTTPLDQARSALAAVKPTDASNSAQSVIDAINGASDQGTMRAGIGVGVLVALLLILVAAFVMLRRRGRAAAGAASGTVSAVAGMPAPPPAPVPNVFDPAAMAGFTPTWSSSPESSAPPALPAPPAAFPNVAATSQTSGEASGDPPLGEG